MICCFLPHYNQELMFIWRKVKKIKMKKKWKEVWEQVSDICVYLLGGICMTFFSSFLKNFLKGGCLGYDDKIKFCMFLLHTIISIIPLLPRLWNDYQYHWSFLIYRPYVFSSECRVPVLFLLLEIHCCLKISTFYVNTFLHCFSKYLPKRDFSVIDYTVKDDV